MRTIRVNQTCVNKLGDTAAMEPALSALAIRDKIKIELHVDFTNGHDQLYFQHPSITPVPDAFPDPDRTVVVADAFHHALANGLPFGAGFYHQLGMEAGPGDRVHFKSYDVVKNPSRREVGVLVAYNSHSCRSRDHDTGLLRPGVRPNSQPPLEWWKPVIESISEPVRAICGIKRPWDLDFPHAETVRGLSITDLLYEFTLCRLLVSVETGVLHLASSGRTPTVYLSCSTPANFVCPDAEVAVIRAPFADEFSHVDTIAAIRRMIS